MKSRQYSHLFIQISTHLLLWYLLNVYALSENMLDVEKSKKTVFSPWSWHQHLGRNTDITWEQLGKCQWLLCALIPTDLITHSPCSRVSNIIWFLSESCSTHLRLSVLFLCSVWSSFLLSLPITRKFLSIPCSTHCWLSDRINYSRFSPQRLWITLLHRKGVIIDVGMNVIFD